MTTIAQIQPRFSAAFKIKTGPIYPEGLVCEIRDQVDLSASLFKWRRSDSQKQGDLFIGLGSDSEDAGEGKFQQQIKPSRKRRPDLSIMEQAIIRQIHRILQDAKAEYEFRP